MTNTLSIQNTAPVSTAPKKPDNTSLTVLLKSLEQSLGTAMQNPPTQSVGDSGPPPWPPAPPWNVPSNWYPPAMPKPWDQMSYTDKVAYLEACIGAIQYNLDHLEDFVPSCAANPGGVYIILQQEFEQTLTAYQAALNSLVNNPPVDPFSGFNFITHLPLLNFKPGQGMGEDQMMQIECLLAEVLSELEEIIGIAGKGRSNIENNMTRINLDQANLSLDNAKETLREVEAAIQAANSSSLLDKVFQGILGGLMTLLAVATGQIELAAVSAALLVASQTGALNKAIQLLSQELQKAGLSQKDANLIATIIVVVVIVAVSVVASNGGSAAQEVETATANTARTAANTAADTTAETANGILDKVWEALKSAASKLKTAYQQLPKAVHIGIIVGTQAIQDTNFISAITPFMKNLSDKEKEIIENLITTLTALLSAILGGASMSSLPTGQMTSIAMKLERGLQYLTKALQVTASVNQGALASINLDLADKEEKLAINQASQDFFQMLGKMMMGRSQTDNRSLAETLQADNNNLNSLLQAQPQAGAALANILTSRA